MADTPPKLTLAPFGGTVDIRDGTTCRALSPKPVPTGTESEFSGCGSVISGELQSACTLPDSPQTRPYEKAQARKVLSWLRLEQSAIIQAEQRWSIDRRAIAGAIAWEALKNVKVRHLFSRWSGPGKIHFFQFTTTSALEEVARHGYLPTLGHFARSNEVQSASSAINCIAAIMRAFGDVAAQLGGYCDIYWWPVMLTNFYNGWNLDDAIAYFPTKKKFPAELKPGNAMSKWVLMNLLYLEDAVGRLPEGCRLPPSPIKGVKPFGALCSDRVKQAKS